MNEYSLAKVQILFISCFRYLNVKLPKNNQKNFVIPSKIDFFNGFYCDNQNMLLKAPITQANNARSHTIAR